MEMVRAPSGAGKRPLTAAGPFGRRHASLRGGQGPACCFRRASWSHVCVHPAHVHAPCERTRLGCIWSRWSAASSCTALRLWRPSAAACMHACAFPVCFRENLVLLSGSDDLESDEDLAAANGTAAATGGNGAAAEELAAQLQQAAV